MITTTVLGPGRARIVLDGMTPATISGQADTTILGTAAIDRLTVMGLRRGTITTGAGNDVVSITIGLAGATDVITLDTGTGNDSVTAAGIRNATISGGDGPDIFRFVRGEGATTWSWTSGPTTGSSCRATPGRR